MPSKSDELEIEVSMETGLIRVITPRISAANHGSASDFMRYLARLAGGETTSTPRTKTGHVHTHEHAKEQA